MDGCCRKNWNRNVNGINAYLGGAFTNNKDRFRRNTIILMIPLRNNLCMWRYSLRRWSNKLCMLKKGSHEMHSGNFNKYNSVFFVLGSDFGSCFDRKVWVWPALYTLFGQWKKKTYFYRFEFFSKIRADWNGCQIAHTAVWFCWKGFE